MTAIRSFGFLREIYGNSDLPSIHELRGEKEHPHDRAAADYLLGGATLLSAPEQVTDPLRPGSVAGEACVLTDGEWVWPGELSYLVAFHHVRLPEDLLDRMRRHHWRPPEVSDVQVGRLLEEFLAEGPLSLEPAEPLPDPFEALPELLEGHAPPISDGEGP